MQRNLYRLYEHGMKMHRSRDAIAGDLLMHRRQNGTNRLFRLPAVLHNPDGQSVLPLIDSRVVSVVAKGGMVVKGTEVVGRSLNIDSEIGRSPQTWWCQLIPRET